MDIKKIIEKAVKRKSLTYMLIVIAIMLGIFLFMNKGYAFSFFAGVPEVTDIEQAQKLYDKGIRYVSISAEELYYTDYIIETIVTEDGKEKSRKVTSSFWVVEEEEKFFFVELPISYYNDKNFTGENVTFKGFLKRETKDLDILSWASDVLADDMGMDADIIREDFIGNLYIDATYSESGLLISTMILMSILLICFLALIWLIMRFINYQKHKIYRVMDNYGGIDEVLETIQKEIDDLGNYGIANTNKDFVLKTYTVCTANSLGIYPTKDLAWAYGYTVRTNGVVTGRSIKLKFIGKKAELEMKMLSQNQSDEILRKLAYSLPIIVGYDAKILKLYNRSQDEFIELWQKTKDNFNSIKNNSDNSNEN